ncbi:hypothetical protein GTP46_11260 [Duganella sp. FT135W]|uniref:Transporter substrate-binding domain-containing protein n=1 Tax=Duganella flavida TaxID=2692175 RepID=A0A6L8KBK0_9BURK|nr:amino acid ABC transporter substrate-binding protein [Duganella flavida]MYM23224.1 hypothetical protein [Duganella flavida]
MYRLYLKIALLLAATQSGAVEGCEPISFGYLDQERPPYWLGVGTAVPERPGASVELVQRVAASVKCAVKLKRIPVLRIRAALASGEVDFAPMDSSSEHVSGIEFPRDKNHELDITRGLPQRIVVYVRASDQIPANTRPITYFKQRRLGITLGSSYKTRMEKVGLQVDSGAMDISRNLEKLRLNRIDGFAVSVVFPEDMDSYVAKRYGRSIVRMQNPLFVDHIWLAVNQSYYSAHQGQVEKMWTWLGSTGRKQFAELLKEYSAAN